MNKFSLWTKLLIALGLRSRCCGERTYVPTGWPKEYCSKCNTLLFRW